MDLPEATINKLAEIVLNSQAVYRKNQAFVDHVSKLQQTNGNSSFWGSRAA